jgi:hypothetical protein
MKEFQENPAFVEMLEGFRKSFSFEEPEAARTAGRDGEGSSGHGEGSPSQEARAEKRSK